jgi:hypothetical protein
VRVAADAHRFADDRRHAEGSWTRPESVHRSVVARAGRDRHRDRPGTAPRPSPRSS